MTTIISQSPKLKAWDIVSSVLKFLTKKIKPGITTRQLDMLAEEIILKMGGTPYNKGYLPKWAKTPFRTTLCTSVNDELCHGIPSNRQLVDGDILSLDVGVKKDGLCGDGAITVGVGTLSNKDERLLRYGKQTLMEGINIIRDGVRLKEIARVMEVYAGLRGYVINHVFGGHGLGSEMHEPPFISHVTWPMGSKMAQEGEYILKAGDMICLEPILTYKDKIGYPDANGWTWKTRDGKKSAIFEHQLLVKENGHDVLTTHL